MSPLVQILAAANRPAPAPTPATVYPTNVASIYNNYDQSQMDAYRAQISQQNAQFGGLAALGSAGINAIAPGAGTALSALSHATPDYGQTYNVNVGGYSMPMFGRPGGTFTSPN